MDKVRVAVIMGGISSEREVSLRSGAQVLGALNAEKYEITPLDFTGDVAPLIALKDQVDLAFLALHGFGGEDGRIQGLLELLDIPYTGSGVLGSAAAMHKDVAKALYRDAGIPTPRAVLLTPAAHDAARVFDHVGLPCVIKPANEGSSIGISIVHSVEALTNAIADAFRFDTEVLAETFIAGTEISVPVLGTTELRALPAVEIIPQTGFYDYANKYTPGATEEVCPARISAAATAAAATYALKAHQVLRCKGYSRTDMLVDGDAVTVLETNTLPGMTQTSLIPLSANADGMSFSALLDYIIDDALRSAVA